TLPYIRWRAHGQKNPKIYLALHRHQLYLTIYLIPGEMSMFRHFHQFGSPFGHWAGRRGWRKHFGPGEGMRGRGLGMGGGEMMRAGRMLAQGDLRLIALGLIAEQPRHGYEIIKVLEEKTGGWYSPSPGIVYPTLTYLEEAGYVTAQSEGAKKLYS